MDRPSKPRPHKGRRAMTLTLWTIAIAAVTALLAWWEMWRKQ
jgi:hypothetical protein